MMGSSRTDEKGKAPAYANIIDLDIDEDNFDPILDMPLSIASWEDIHRSVARVVPEPSGNPRVYSMNPNILQNPQTNLGLSGLSDWNMGWGQQYMNQGHSAPNNVGFNTEQSGVQGKSEGSFLSLGLGGASETVSDELKIARARRAASQAFNEGFMGSQSNNSGLSNRFSSASRMTSTNNDDGFMGSTPHHILQMQQNDRRLRRANKLTEVTEPVSTELKMVHIPKPTGQTSDADFMGFQTNNRDRMTSTNYEVGVHSTLNSGPRSSRHHALQMQGYDSRKMRSGDLDRYKSNQSVQLPQHNFKPPECVKPSWMNMNSYYTPSEQPHHFHSTTAHSPNYAGKQGQVASQNATPTQALGGNPFSQRTATPQVSWVGRGSADNNAPFPKRLGVEFSLRNCPQSSQEHLSPMGTSLQTANSAYAYQIRRFSDKGSDPHNVVRPIGQSDGSPVGYRVNYQQPSFTYAQSPNSLTQLPIGPQGAPSTNASTVNSQSQKLDFHVGPHHKRAAVAPQSSSHWVKRQKIIHPTIHHSMPKPHIPVTTAFVHPSIPVRSRTQPTGPVTGHVAPHIRPVISRASSVKPRVHLASAPAVSHITWKDPDATSKLSGRKCFLCKRDLA